MANPMDPLAWAIMVIGLGVLVRAIRLQAALMLFVLIILSILSLPYAGRFAQYVPFWVFVGIVLVVGINILRAVLGILFGQSAADGFTGRLLYSIFTPIFRFIGGILRTIFRVR